MDSINKPAKQLFLKKFACVDLTAELVFAIKTDFDLPGIGTRKALTPENPK